MMEKPEKSGGWKIQYLISLLPYYLEIASTFGQTMA
jgi:hypothetical protein